MTHENPTFIGDDDGQSKCGTNIYTVTVPPQQIEQLESVEKAPEVRQQWSKDIEFLLSCIAMSVGLGNVWRFPFTALQNGGGAFLIPYIIVLFFVGKPIYYLEMILGQFSSRGPVKVFDLCPAMRGIGIGQVYSIGIVTTYYTSIMAITLKYLYDSCYPILPWTICKDSWTDMCIGSIEAKSKNESYFLENPIANDIHPKTSAELYFLKDVLQEKDNIEDGIGLPNGKLALTLFLAWVTVYFTIVQGVKSSGKASYFLATFPYVVMVILLIRAVTLPGSLDGIYYFIRPQWDQILNPQVWYAAVTQVFYSLSVCFGNVIMYSSYNRFDHNVYRDATIVTLLDTITSLLAGFITFGILGNLAYEIGTNDVGSVVRAGSGLAFISYPDAIAKFKNFPQFFSILFFLMLFVLGIGSNIAMTSCTITSIRDYFPKLKQSHCALCIASISFLIGLVYVTPGGQFILTLVDHFGASMIALTLGIFELYVLGWVYGVDRLCKDADLMMGKKVGLYWRLTWSLITPIIMTLILIYFFASYEALSYNNSPYPNWAYVIGWTITIFGIIQVPIWICVAVFQQPEKSFKEKFFKAFRPRDDWGPSNILLRENYFKTMYNDRSNAKNLSIWKRLKKNIFG